MPRAPYFWFLLRVAAVLLLVASAAFAVIATTFDGFFAIDSGHELRFYDFAGNALRDYGFQYVTVDAVARSGSTDVAIVEEGTIRCFSRRGYSQGFGDAAHHRAAR